MSEIEKRKVGRPSVNATPITLRLLPDMLARLDAERAKRNPEPSRPEMIRMLLESGLPNPEGE